MDNLIFSNYLNYFSLKIQLFDHVASFELDNLRRGLREFMFEIRKDEVCHSFVVEILTKPFIIDGLTIGWILT